MAFILADFARLCNDGFRAKCAFTIIMEFARRGATECNADFETIAAQAAQAWNEKRSAIEIEADDERDVRLFDSNDFIIPFVEPGDWSGESFLAVSVERDGLFPGERPESDA